MKNRKDVRDLKYHLKKDCTTDEPTNHSQTLLYRAIETLQERGKLRDLPQGERSMKSCVEAFNGLYGTNLSVTQGWVFLMLLKLSRSKGKHDLDNWVDLVGYAALAGEDACNAHSSDLQ